MHFCRPTVSWCSVLLSVLFYYDHQLTVSAQSLCFALCSIVDCLTIVTPANESQMLGRMYYDK